MTPQLRSLMAGDSLKIIENALVATCDRSNRIGRFTILVRGDRIAEVSQRAEALKTIYPGAEVIDAADSLVVPGFIDAHCHGESFLLRRATASLSYTEWPRAERLQHALTYLKSKATPDELFHLYLITYYAALRSGVTTLVEFGMEYLDSALKASCEAFRRSDLKGFVGIHNGDQLEIARKRTGPGLRFAVALPPEEVLTTYALQTSLRSAKESKFPLLVHLGETKSGNETIRKNFGKPLIKLLDEYKLLQYNILLTQPAPLEKSEISLLAKTGTPVICCPLSTLAKGEEPPNYEALLRKDVPIAFGTDWGLSDPLANIRAFITLARASKFDLPGGSALLAMVTRNPAEALGIEEETGSIEPGKKADLTFIDISALRERSLIGSGDPEMDLFNLLNEIGSHHVEAVTINGEFFVRNKVILTCSEEELIDQTRDLARTLLPPIEPPQEEKPESENADTLSNADAGWGAGLEEGFRIIQRTTGGDKAAAASAGAKAAKKVELPKTTRTVFGDDDL